jgi:aconitate hydratase
VIAKSIERIHWANLVNFGIIPMMFVDENDFDIIEQSDELSMKDIIKAVKFEETFIIRNITKNYDFKVKLELSKREREIILAGGVLNHISNSK